MAQSREELENKLAALEKVALDADPKAAAGLFGLWKFSVTRKKNAREKNTASE